MTFIKDYILIFIIVTMLLGLGLAKISNKKRKGGIAQTPAEN